MSGIFPQGLGNGLLSRRLALVVAGSALGGLLIALAAGFLGFAAYLGLLGVVAPWQAALIVAAVAALIAGVALFLAFRLAGRTVDQVKTGVRSSAVALVAPTAFRFAARNVKLAASLAALAGAIFAFLRAKNRHTEKEG
jgi:chromate transport protein ChrA